jgi:hypothetical protein
MRRRTRLRAAACVLLMLLGPGCGGREDPAAKASLEEATVTAEIRSRLLMVDGLARLPLSVETRDGTATIRGTVADTLQPAAIRAIVARVRGVEHVDLELRVVPPADTTAPAPGPARAARRHAPGSGDRASPAGDDAPRPAARPDSLPARDETG